MSTFIGCLLAAILAVTSGTYITQGAFPLSDSIIAAVQDPANHQKIVEWVDSIGLNTDEAWASIMAQVEEIQAGKRENVDLTGQQLVDIMDKAVTTMPDTVSVDSRTIDISKPDHVYKASVNWSYLNGGLEYSLSGDLSVYVVDNIPVVKQQDMNTKTVTQCAFAYPVMTNVVPGARCDFYLPVAHLVEMDSEYYEFLVHGDKTTYNGYRKYYSGARDYASDPNLTMDGLVAYIRSSSNSYLPWVDNAAYGYVDASKPLSCEIISYTGTPIIKFNRISPSGSTLSTWMEHALLASYYDEYASQVIDLQKDRDYLMQVITGLKKKLEEDERLAASVISIPVGQTAEQTDAIISSIAEALAAANANANVNTQALIDAIAKAQADAKAAEAEGELDMDLGKLRLGEAILTRFPFCIPFDLVNAIGAFSGLPRTPPKWVIPVNIWGTENSITIDFAQFDIWAKIIRWGVLICFNVGLIVVTRKLIKG